MKCPVCNTWVMVKETRARPNNVAYRRYECANEHRFITLEKVERVIEKKEEPKKKSAWRKRQIEEQRMIEDPEEEAWKEIEAKSYAIKQEPANILEIRKDSNTEVIRIGPEGHLFWRGREVETDDDFRGAMMDLAAAMRQNMIPPQREFNQGWNAALDSAANQVAGMFGGEDTADSFAVFFRNMKV